MSKSRRRYTPFTLDNSWVVEFPTEPAGVLRLGPGLVRIGARSSFRPQDGDGWYSLIDCDLRLADADGRLWHATSSFLADALFYPVVDLSRREPGHWLRKAPTEWREALAERPLLRDAPWTFDDRFHRFVWLDNTGFCWQFKYFGARFDVAALDESTLVVSIADLFCSWGPVPVAGEDGAPLPLAPVRPRLSDEEWEEEYERLEEAGDAGDYDHAPPVAYAIDAGRVLFRNTLQTAEEDADRIFDQRVSRPLVFRRAKGRGSPQPVVTFHRGARPTPATPLPGPSEGFVPLGGEFDEAMEFGTDAGGRLLVSAGPGRYAVRLDRHPGSATEPVDVLRARVRLTDEAGDVWEAVSLFTPEVFLDPEERAAERSRWKRDARLPPIVYTMPLHDLAFRNTTFAVDDGFWHRNAIPIPVVFARVGQASSRAGVRFMPDAQ